MMSAFAQVGILVPDDRVVGHGDDVGLAVAVDVGQGQGVADLADPGVDLLGAEGREVVAEGRWEGGQDEKEGGRERGSHGD